MRNLKKLLALVLAMVMAFSLMLSASAVDYKDYQDKDNITEEFKEAVQVLTGLKVFQGDEGGFRPGDTITRAEVAAIVYRIATGDVDGNQVKIYADYGNFTDVDRNEWYAGYVGYCANAGYIKGTTPTTFEPGAPVTGWQALAMILRVVGYDKNGEFTGPAWQTNVASLSKNLGITNNVKNANFETTLSYAGRRDVVADLLFQTAVKVPTVTYTAALGYNDRISISETRKNTTLGQKTFGLFCDEEWKEVDKWGRPGYYWVKGGSHVISKTVNNQNASTINSQYRYDEDWMPVYGGDLGTSSNPTANVVATIMPVATKTYTTTVRECDVAHDLDFDGDKAFRLHVNAKTAVTDRYTVRATDTVTRVGGQGRTTEFWYGVESDFAGKLENWTVMVDTYLAKVTKVTPVVKDAAGHIINKAELHLDVWDDGSTGTYNSADSTRGNDSGDTSKHVATKNTDWEYTVGQYVLIQGYTDKSLKGNLNHKTSGATAQADIEKTAFETNMLVARNAANTKENDDKIDVLHAVEPKLAKQTTTYWNSGKHQVDGKDENDQMTLFMDYAGTKTNSTFAWYYDDLGNIIGIGPVPNTVNYGVITSIYAAFKQGENATTGEAEARAHVLYANGDEADVVIDKFFVSGTVSLATGNGAGTGGHPAISAGTMGAAMKDGASKANTMELRPVYDYNNYNGNTMMSSNASFSTVAAGAAYLNVAPVSNVNTSVEKFLPVTGNNGYYGIIKGNLFKFVASVDGEMTAIEVGGDDGTVTGSGNTDRYYGHFNLSSAATAGQSKIFKNLAYVTVDNDSTAKIWLDNDTKIMINNNSSELAKQTITCYNGVSDLPGNVAIAENTEIDWADTDGDGRADYLYVYGRVEGSTTYGMFYYNGGAAQWNGTTGTLAGWLNGEEKTLTFYNETQFKSIRESYGYDAHLFAVELTNDVVSDVMQAQNNQSSVFGIRVLQDNDSGANPLNPSGTKLATDWGTNSVIKGSNGTTTFGLGSVKSQYGNPYTTKTEAVYYRDANVKVYTDLNTTTTEHMVVYDSDRQTVVITDSSNNTTTYKLTPNTKIIGLGMGVATGTPVLEYLNHSVKNDVTIVYENNGILSVTEIYVATDPNVTPGPGTQVPSSASGMSDSDNARVLNSSSSVLENYLKSGIRDVVVFNSGAEVNGGSNGDPGHLIYFPFSTPIAQAVTLTIRNSNGTEVYIETGNISAGNEGAHFFTVNFANYGNNASAYSAGAMTAGVYTFTITSGATTLSSGIFTLI